MVKRMYNVAPAIQTHNVLKMLSFAKNCGNDSPEAGTFAYIEIRVRNDRQRERKSFEIVMRFGDEGCGLEVCDDETTIPPFALKTQGLYACCIGPQGVCEASCAGFFERGKWSGHKR